MGRRIIKFHALLLPLRQETAKKEEAGRVEPRAQGKTKLGKAIAEGKATEKYAIVRGHTNDELPKEVTGEGAKRGVRQHSRRADMLLRVHSWNGEYAQEGLRPG